MGKNVKTHYYDGRVLNLYTGQYYYYDRNLHPKLAVIAAYAQNKKNNWNTWTYEEKYGGQVRETLYCYSIDDFSVIKNMEN